MKYAEIENGAVTGFWAESSIPGKVLVPALSDTEVGDLWDGSAFSKPIIADTEPVPEYISKIALKYALGTQWSTVKTAIDADPVLKEDWDLTYRIYRNSPLMLGAATALGFTDSQIDDIFRAAEQVTI